MALTTRDTVIQTINQSILKEISPGCSLEGLMLKLKFQYFGHLMQRADSLEKTLMMGRIGGITHSMDMVLVDSRSWWWTGRPGVLRFMGSQRVGHDWVTELNWIKLNINNSEKPKIEKWNKNKTRIIILRQIKCNKTKSIHRNKKYCVII